MNNSTFQPWYRSTMAVALCGSLLLWAALPPLALAPLGWIAPLPWLFLIRRDRLEGRRPYLALYLAGLVFWLMAIHWLRLPHPAVYLGWIALSAYLACYLPVFVSVSRVAVHRLAIPVWLAAPVVWTGLELARAYLLTGFLMASLAHTQVRVARVIQISDIFGEYGVDFVIMMVASTIACVLFAPRRPWAFVPGAVVLTCTLAYGYWRIDDAPTTSDGSASTVRVALIQGNSLPEWKFDPSRERQIMDEYMELSERAVTKAAETGRPLDLIVWPETMFRSSLVTFDPDYELPPEAPNTKEDIAAFGPDELARFARRVDTAVLVGIDRAHVRAPAAPGEDPPPALRYNSAALVAPNGELIGTYDKVHRVMFGEYIPFAHWLPFLYSLTPLTGGIQAGAEPAVLPLDSNTFIAPSICYETVIPHVIRRQADALYQGSVSPNVLVNLTNDAWYWGSSELDQHLACGVFRAIETRMPLVIAANGGISAWIDPLGRVRAQSPRMATDVIIADIEPRASDSLYVRYGAWFAALCLTATAIIAMIGCFTSLHLPANRAATPPEEDQLGRGTR